MGTAFEQTLFPLGKGTKITEEGGCVGGGGGMKLKRLRNLPGKKSSPSSACEPVHPTATHQGHVGEGQGAVLLVVAHSLCAGDLAH